MKLIDFDIGLEHPFFLIAGPCVVESRQLAIDTAGELKEMTDLSQSLVLQAAVFRLFEAQP